MEYTLPETELIKIKTIEQVDNRGLFELEPLSPGYGVTIGNSLRRVLLSSLEGAAITAVKIEGAEHQFTTLPKVKEDVVEIILNLKKLRLRVFSQEEVKLTLEARGEGEVTAGQIEATSDVEIVNSDLHIATLTDPKAKLEMEIFVSQGRGYVPVEEKDRKKLELGCIAVDSIFTPVLNVGYKVDFVRVGEITNYERLTLTIETDGTITPVSALNQATQILLDHFNLILEGYGGKTEQPVLAAMEALAEETIETPEEKAEEPVGEETKPEKKSAKKPAKRGRPKKNK